MQKVEEEQSNMKKIAEQKCDSKEKEKSSKNLKMKKLVLDNTQQLLSYTNTFTSARSEMMDNEYYYDDEDEDDELFMELEYESRLDRLWNILQKLRNYMVDLQY